MPATEVLVDGLDHPEGVAWDPEAEMLWAGGEAHPHRPAPPFPERLRGHRANLARWHLTLLDVGLCGAPLHYPERWAVDE
jgi:hypothetical protein